MTKTTIKKKKKIRKSFIDVDFKRKIEYSIKRVQQLAIKELFYRFSGLSKREAVDTTDSQVSDWLDAKEVKVHHKQEELIWIWSPKLKKAIECRLSADKRKARIHYTWYLVDKPPHLGVF